uniref:Uncharacterized protein n=1 Tax=Caenorhabditis japonica TaxID=281687 RepID=A0A8R1I1E4_CAEJA
MNTLKVLSVFCVLFALISAQQWTPQQLAAYRQQYYNWWYNQQRMQQAQQVQAPAPVANTPSPFFGNVQSDSKGNYWHGDDNVKLLLVARSSLP